ncbi:MAG: pimeloyl-ACP methyl ester esterase BioH [Cycloclasticus sp.]|nr:pimeloyl-ACP methyl ester esterase BioH [Cycloclasticus sp.]
MKLNLQQSGDGPVLVLIHGWAMSSAIWQSMLPRLEQSFTVICMDLPGHDGSEYADAWALDELLESMAEQLPPKCTVLGWSLGGMLALAYTNKYPQRVSSLIMLGSSPKFVQSDDWLCGQENDVLEAFQQGLIKDSSATIKRFVSLQTQGMERPKETRKLLLSLLGAGPQPSKNGLTSGLRMLQNLDLRHALKKVSCPLLMLLGEKDNLIPVGVGEQSQAINPRIKLVVIKQAAHVLFLSHTSEVLELIEQFLWTKERAL